MDHTLKNAIPDRRPLRGSGHLATRRAAKKEIVTDGRGGRRHSHVAVGPCFLIAIICLEESSLMPPRPRRRLRGSSPTSLFLGLSEQAAVAGAARHEAREWRAHHQPNSRPLWAVEVVRP